MTRHYCDMGYLPRYCGAWLEGLAGTTPDPARVVEVGTATGCSLNALLIGLSKHNDCFVWTVDIRPLPILKDEMKKLEVPEDKWEQITGNSIDVVRNWNVPLDLVYIDGDHSYQGCQADIHAWEQHLKLGGLMVFDDYEQFMWGVTEAVDDIMFAKDSTWRFVGQVGRMIAFEKGTAKERSPWLTDYMVKYHSNSRNWITREPDPWLCWAWGFLGHKNLTGPLIMPRRFYGKSHDVNLLP